jgi:hypothetical protein
MGSRCHHNPCRYSHPNIPGRRSAKKSDHSVETPFTFAEGQAQLKMYERALANVGIQDVTSVVQPVR